MEADFSDAIEAIESLPENVVAAINTASQKLHLRFYFYVVIMRSVELSLSKEVDMAAEHTHAEMGGGKDLAEDHNYVVVIAGIGLVEVLGHSSSEWAERSSIELKNKTGVRPSREWELDLVCL